MSVGQRQIALSEEVFRLFKEMIYDLSGIFFSDDSKIILESRLQSALRRRGFDDFRDYYYFLKYDPKREEEWAFFIDAITIHETYFFREERQLQTFRQEVLPELARPEAKTRELKIWSAGCSTGEEPYTLSMLILESPLFRDWTVEIYASDISEKVLQHARRGIYSASSFRAIAPYFQMKYFMKEADGWKISDRVKKSVTFLHLNLNDRERWALLPSMDVIFCRNVLIYFDQASKRRGIDLFYEKLKKGGYLFLGHSESLINLSTRYLLRNLQNDLIYQKPVSEG
ncbi:MAG: CheR family methyltransferase [Candidatus Manganitrophaceae bacterium]